ncbi:MAG: hypothetical protein WAU91_16455 [Desulfatitalea sp.]
MKGKANTKTDRICFVVSPIGEENSAIRKRSDDVLEYIIKPALQKYDLEPVRSDHIAAPGMITNQIINHILSDKLVIADLTDHNPNVYYELALRHAFRKPVIQLVLNGQKLPFDIIGFRTIPYNLELAGALAAKKELEKAIESVLSDDVDVKSPVTIAAKIEDLTRSKSPENQAIIQSVVQQLDTLTGVSGINCNEGRKPAPGAVSVLNLL